MATHEHSVVGFTHEDDAHFQQWATALSAGLDEIGLEKVADWSHPDLSTALRPAANTYVAGTELRKFADDLFDEYPLYVEIRYGTGSSATIARTNWAVRLGYDGVAGTTQPATYVPTVSVDTNLLSTSPVGLSLACLAPSAGALVVVPTMFTTLQCGPVFILMRSVDETGAPTTDGWFTYGRGPNTPQYGHCQTHYSRSKGYGWYITARDAGDYMGAPPPLICDSTDGEYANAIVWPVATPAPMGSLGCFSYNEKEFAGDSLVDVALVGNTPHRYRCLSGVGQCATTGGSYYQYAQPSGAPYTQTVLPHLAMIWE